MSNVVIASGDEARSAALASAVRSRLVVEVDELVSSEQAAAAGFDDATRVVVVDDYPSAAALRIIADATVARPELAVLVSGPVSPPVEAMVALASGALGYLPAGSAPDVVAAAVEELLAGEAVLPRCVSSPLVQHLRWSGRGVVVEGYNGRAKELTNREWEVLVLLRQGRTTAEIAKRLVVSAGTVRSHVAAIVRKLGLASRSALLSPPSPKDQSPVATGTMS